jgi:hypothetical protein
MEKPKNIDNIIKSESLNKFDLKFVGIGSENVCFEVKGSTKKLIKIDRDVLRKKYFMLLTEDKEILD